MITGENKNKIDQIWNVLFANGINNPILVVEQLTYLLFIKMLDDKQLEEENLVNMGFGTLNDPVFTPENEHLRWHVFCETSAENMFRTVRDEVFPFIKQIGGANSAYAQYIQDARLEISYPNILQSVVDGFNTLNLEDEHAMGDIYEYILDKMAANGNSGQFRTPPHIIKMMVELMAPTTDDIVCDPAMGTAGFLVETATYLKDNCREQLMDPTAQESFRTTMFNGFDTDPTMMRIGSMHLMLNGVVNPNIHRRDSLSINNNDEQLYTLTLANPPFAGSVDAGSIHPALTRVTKTRKTELLFLAQFLRGLKLGGRCASIVPDGVLFGSSNAHVALRKELVENQYLRAVISMPSGVFKPYAGVSTAILIFTRTDNGGTDKVWFYDMKADGFSLDDKRNPIADCDIPDIISRFNNLSAEGSRSRKDQSFLVSVEDIRANDYDLSINKYKEIERVKVNYEPTADIIARLQKTEGEIQEGMNKLEEVLV